MADRVAATAEIFLSPTPTSGRGDPDLQAASVVCSNSHTKSSIHWGVEPH